MRFDFFAVERRHVQRLRDAPHAFGHFRLPRRSPLLRFVVQPLLRAFFFRGDAFDRVPRRQNARQIEHIRFLRMHTIEQRAERASVRREILHCTLLSVPTGEIKSSRACFDVSIAKNSQSWLTFQIGNQREHQVLRFRIDHERKHRVFLSLIAEIERGCEDGAEERVLRSRIG